MNEYALTLDLAKAKQRQQQTIFVRQGDKNATTIVATITDHGVAASTSGMTARFAMRLPNGTEYYRKTATLSGNTATVALDETQAASVAGRTDVAYFQLLQGSTVVASTESFTVVVLPDALADATVPESYDSAIQDAIDALDEAVEQMPDMVEGVLEAHPEWTTTVQDGSITKAKLATDLARDRERLLYRLANMLTATLPEGETATATDAAKTPVAGLALYGRSTQDGTPTPSAPVAIQSVTPNIAVTPYTHFDYASSRGVTYTQNADGSITASGTAGSSLAYLGLCTHSDNTFGLERGKTYTLVVSSGNVTLLTITGGSSNNKVAVVTVPTSGNWTVGVGVLAGRTVNETFRFSVFEGDVTALSPVPYNSVGLFAQGRNLLPNHPQSMDTGKGITFTDNGDGSYGISGTATANAYIYLTNNSSNFKLPAGTYTLSVRDGNGANVAGVRAGASRWVNGANTTYGIAVGAKTFTYTGESNVQLIVEVTSGTTVNATIYPQLEAGSTATAYVPYAETVTPIPLDGHELRSLPDGTRDELTVDERGHAVLVQRVGVAEIGAADWTANSNRYRASITSYGVGTPSGGYDNTRCTAYAPTANTTAQQPADTIRLSADGNYAWLGASSTRVDSTLLYPLATPVTIDLGYVAAVPLVGPDLTAQAVPSAPMQLTYERDLNTTLARLESAIATLA